MIEKFEITGNGYKVEDGFRKHVKKKLGKLDRYLPRGFKKDIMMRVTVSEIGKTRGDKYEVSVAMEIPGGKVLAAKDECSNVFTGVDMVETKLSGQIRRYKLETQPHRQKRSLKNLFIKRG